MDDTLTYRGTVYPWHCDHMGHMNVMWYVGKSIVVLAFVVAAAVIWLAPRPTRTVDMSQAGH